MSDHILVIEHETNDPNSELVYEIEHPDECVRRENHEWYIVEYECAVGWEESHVGLVDALRIKDLEELGPGRYRIEHWHETYHGFDYTEHDTGLRIVT